MRSFLRKVSYVLTFVLGGTTVVALMKYNERINEFVKTEHRLPWMYD